MSAEKIRVRDGRPGLFWVYDALMDDPRLSERAKWIYTRLARLVKGQGAEVTISQADLAKLCGMGITSLYLALKVLEKTHWLDIESIPAADGSRTMNTYKLLPPPSVPGTEGIGATHRGVSVLHTEGIGARHRTNTKAEVEAATEVETESKAEVNPAPDGADLAVVALGSPLEAPARPRQAAGSGQTAAPPKGHPAFTAYCDVWKGKYGRNPDIEGKDAATLARLSKKQGIEEFTRRLERYLRDEDSFLIKLAHPASQFENRWNALGIGVNGHGTSRAGQESAGANRLGTPAGRQSINEKWKAEPKGLVTL